ncbi:hypothetical protein [Saccharothrix sp. NRRL B-16314]|uniref:hypothetical protein n=1 Tax=Saccharothrix sp. NRRL B-16314 TaxID=1463825 RepID=UPI000524F605|nr:hypothetical protein [Saccharothrix sp. NRRL B-16314]
MVPHGPDQRERLRCVDCNAEADPSGTGPVALTHEHGCPASAVDRSQRADDLRWLRANPGGTRTRPPSTAERDALRMALDAPPYVLDQVRVHVHQIDGTRLLIFTLLGVPLIGSADVHQGGAA